VLDILIRSVRSPEASFTASVVQRMIAQAPGHMQVSYLSGEGANKATIRFVPEVWMDWQVTSGGQQTPLHALMFYHWPCGVTGKTSKSSSCCPAPAISSCRLNWSGDFWQ